jgi:hypothetical protein
MRDFFVFGLILAGASVCFFRWRAGFFVVILFGFLQDPIRKLYAGEPVVFTLLALVMFGFCLLGALWEGENLGFSEINRWNPVLFWPLVFFLGWVGFSATLTFLHTGSLILVIIGLLAYAAPVPALLLGYRFTRRLEEFEHLILFYVALAVLSCVGVLLEVQGVPAKVLGAVGDGFVFYPESGGYLVLASGFFRSPEIAAWHLSTAVCLLAALCLQRGRSQWFYLLAGLALLVLFPSLIATGRRKFLLEIFIFLALTGGAFWFFAGKLRRLGPVLLLFSLVAAALYYYITSSELPGEWKNYIDRSATAREDSVNRFRHMTVDMFYYVVQRNGWLGSGAGTGSQGAQHFGGGSVLVGAAAEGGVGKILAELGLPGIFFLLCVGWALVRYFDSVGRGVHSDPELGPWFFSVVGFLGANLVVFSTAHQAFGDTFILLLLGIFVGFALRTPYLREDIPADEDRVALPRVRLGRRFANRKPDSFAGTNS